MTRKNLTSLTGTTLTVLALFTMFGAVTAKPAAADEQTDYYRSAMRDLIGLTDQWSHDLNGQVATITIKPEQACAAEYQDFVQQGGWLADDLAGSALSAPAEVADANRLAAEGFREMVNGAQAIAQSCDGSALATGTKQISTGKAQYRQHITAVTLWVYGDAIRSVPRLPVLPLH
jgi:hypothetical protein